MKVWLDGVEERDCDWRGNEGRRSEIEIHVESRVNKLSYHVFKLITHA